LKSRQFQIKKFSLTNYIIACHPVCSVNKTIEKRNLKNRI